MNRNTFSFECPNFNWANSIKQYQHTKLNPFEGRSCSPPQKISHKDIKHAEVFYNPITQKYNDKDFHRKTVSIEKNIIPNRIASYQDNALRYEQTYDIINLRDKLKVFKDHSDYPKVKDPSKNKSVIDMSKKEFNILSNINLKVHHFDKPENRPDKPSTSPVIKPLKKQLWTFKDYDIITNKYVEDHQKKEKVNDQAFKLEAANKYWATHDFNPVLGKFFDPLKESKFQDEEKKKAEIWGKDRVLRLPKKVQDEGLLYNPVNTKILDEERLKQYDLKIKNQKKRYERKNEIEDFILNKGISISERDEKRRMNRKCYEYYKVTDNRGYDIVNFNKNYNTYKSTLILKDNISDWDKLKNKSSMNKSTFNSKRIYKEEYDYFDANDHLHTFKQNRESKGFIYYILTQI